MAPDPRGLSVLTRGPVAVCCGSHAGARPAVSSRPSRSMWSGGGGCSAFGEGGVGGLASGTGGNPVVASGFGGTVADASSGVVVGCAQPESSSVVSREWASRGQPAREVSCSVARVGRAGARALQHGDAAAVALGPSSSGWHAVGGWSESQPAVEACSAVSRRSSRSMSSGGGGCSAFCGGGVGARALQRGVAMATAFGPGISGWRATGGWNESQSAVKLEAASRAGSREASAWGGGDCRFAADRCCLPRGGCTLDRASVVSTSAALTLGSSEVV